MDDQNKKPDDWHGFTYGGQNRPDNREDDQAPRMEREDPYAGVRNESEPYTFGPFGKNTPYRTEEDREPANTAQPEVMPAAREYRPFTVTGNSRGGSWQAPPRRSNFRSMFAAFLVGVVAVGGLMFAADRNDWFSSQTLGGTAAPVAAKTTSNPVSNSADVVRPNNIAKVFEQSSPAVVKIETYVNSAGSRGGTMDDFFSQFFGDGTGNGDGSGGSNGGSDGSGGTGGSSGGALQPSGMGSGFIFDSTGYILTNQHVVGDAAEIQVTVVGHSKPFKAKLLGSSYDLDLAVLKIEGSDFPTLKLGDSSSANMGDWVVAIGNPYGFDHTVTVGILSSNEREISIQDQAGTRNYQHLLQTDASINPGNSGGPLLNLKGEVIGINTAVSSQAQGIGFAIPTSTISEVLNNLKNNTQIPKKPVPFIGASLYSMTPDLAKKLGVDVTTGSIVKDVIYGSPAYKADLRAYDIITGMDGKDYKTNEELVVAIQKKNVGDKVTLNVIRNGEKQAVSVEIGDKNKFQNGQQP
jgi:serine protease Do